MCLESSQSSSVGISPWVWAPLLQQVTYAVPGFMGSINQGALVRGTISSLEECNLQNTHTHSLTYTVFITVVYRMCSSQWLSISRSSETPAVVQSMRLDVSVGLQCALKEEAHEPVKGLTVPVREQQQERFLFSRPCVGCQQEVWLFQPQEICIKSGSSHFKCFN